MPHAATVFLSVDTPYLENSLCHPPQHDFSFSFLASLPFPVGQCSVQISASAAVYVLFLVVQLVLLPSCSATSLFGRVVRYFLGRSYVKPFCS